MAASRDDFVIAIRSAFLKKGNKQRFSLIALITFSILLIFLTRLNFTPLNYLKSGLNEVIYRVSFIASLPEQQLKNSISTFKKHYNLYNEYEKIFNELKVLEGEKYNSKYLKSENDRLRKLIDEYVVNSKELVAKVLLDKNSPFLKSIIINKGSKDNITIGMAVLDGPYLVGKIVEVNYTTSRALLISDLNSKVPVAMEPGNILSIMSGSGKQFGTIQYLQDNTAIAKKKIVYTSGSGGLFKPGIPIGKMNEQNKIDFFSDLSQLTFVKIVSFEENSK